MPERTNHMFSRGPRLRSVVLAVLGVPLLLLTVLAVMTVLAMFLQNLS